MQRYAPEPDGLAAWDAVETAERIRAGDVHPREVVEAAVRRAEDAGALGAVVTETFDSAVEAAGRIDGPLAGVPTFVKDLANLAGVRTGFGTGAITGFVPTASDPFIDVAIGTGLVSLGKSSAPEFGLTATTEPVGVEPTRNPWDPDRSVGGSSGGSAALVAAGVVPIATASDGGGSIRIPAAATGTVGLKPSRGRFPSLQGDRLPINILASGVITRTVRDQVAFYAAAEAQMRSRRLPEVGGVDPLERPLRLALVTANPICDPSPEVAEAIGRTVGRLEDLGHTVVEVDGLAEDRFVDEFLDYWAYLAFLIRWTSKVTIGRRFDGRRLEPWTLGLARRFARRSATFPGTLRSLRAYEGEYEARLKGFDAVMTPVTATPPPPIGYLAPDLPFDEHLARVTNFVPYTPPWNVSGAPAISLPLEHTRAGVPIGIQFGARLGQESLLLAIGLQLEESMGGFRRLGADAA
jgi:amidase